MHREEYIKNHLKEFFVKFVESETSRDEERILRFIEVSIRYLYLSTEIKQKEIQKIFFSVSQKIGNKAMTTGEKLIQQGMQKGIQQGIQKGKQEKNKELVKILYQKKNKTVKEICDLLEIDEKFVKETILNS
ncbi:MAG: hypothetical protein ABEH43_09685 [Flavobacteriales bacterium]